MANYIKGRAGHAGRDSRSGQRQGGRIGATGPPVDQLSFVYEQPDPPRASDTNAREAPRAALAMDNNNSSQANTTSDTAIANPVAPFSHQPRAGYQLACPTGPQSIQVSPTPQNGSIPVTSSAANTPSTQGTSRPAPISTLHPLAQSTSRKPNNKMVTNKNMRAILNGKRPTTPRKYSNPERQVLEQTTMKQL